jgi:hypothetical protein
MSTEEYVVVQIGEGFAIYNKEENNIYLSPDKQQATVFPADIGAQVEKSLKDGGVKEAITLVPVTLEDAPKSDA